MRNFKRFFAALMIAAVLGAAVPARKAEAGVLVLVGTIASPFAIVAGVALVYFGVYYRSPLLIVLDENGVAAQDALEAGLARNYAFIEDAEARASLASLLRRKIAGSTPNEMGEILVSVSADELLDILEPTGLIESEPEKVAGLIADLQ